MRFAVVLALVALLACSVSHAFMAPNALRTGACARSHLPAASRPARDRVNGLTVMRVQTKVVVGETESVEHALGRFRRNVSRAGHLQELRFRRTFESNQEKRKRKVQQNRRRNRIQRARMRKAMENQF